MKVAEEHQIRLDRVMPALDEDTYEALKVDIARRGVQVPVEVDEEGYVVDGNHRVWAARALGVDYPSVTRAFASEEERAEHTLKLNLLRRQVDAPTWAGLFRRYCAALGVELGQGARNDRGEGTSASVAEVATELGVSERTARNRLRLADALAEYPYLQRYYDEGRWTAGEVIRRAAERAEHKKEARRMEIRDEKGREHRLRTNPLALNRVTDGGTGKPIYLEPSHTYDIERPGEVVRFAPIEVPVPAPGGVEEGRLEPRPPDFEVGAILGHEVRYSPPTTNPISRPCGVAPTLDTLSRTTSP